MPARRSTVSPASFRVKPNSLALVAGTGACSTCRWKIRMAIKARKMAGRGGEPDWQRFEDTVFDRLRNPRDKSSDRMIHHPISDLRAVVFPHQFDLSRLKDTTLYPDFSHAVFGSWASFEEATFGGGARFNGAVFGKGARFEGASVAVR